MLSISSRYLEYMGDINAIFKSYDIRGLYPQEIDEEVCRNIGYAFAKFLLEEDPQTTKIIVGVDMRLSSESLSDCLLYTSPSPRDSSPSRMPSSA